MNLITKYSLTKKAMSESNLAISSRDAKITAELHEDVDFETGSEVYTVEIKVHSIKGKVALQEFVEFPKNEKGKIRAQELIELVRQNN